MVDSHVEETWLCGRGRKGEVRIKVAAFKNRFAFLSGVFLKRVEIAANGSREQGYVLADDGLVIPLLVRTMSVVNEWGAPVVS